MAAFRHAKAAQWALGVGIWVWVGALIVAPLALRPICAVICHQRTERSFFMDGVQLPVCARCLGLYVGAALAVPFVLRARPAIASARARRILAAAALPTAITWTLEFAGVAGFSNAIRFIAALPLGGAAAWLVFQIIRE